MKPKTYVVVLAAWMLSVSLGSYAQDYVLDVQERVESADWSKIQTVSINLTEFAFSPASLNFQEGIPYKLEIKNEGTTKHYFTAEGFFKAIATRKVQSNSDGEIKAPYFTAIEVYPGRSLDLYFIPVTKGTYELQCTVKDHAEQGMVGEIRIE